MMKTTLKLRDDDKDYLRSVIAKEVDKSISKIVNSVTPKGSEKSLLWLKEWGILGTIIGVIVALLGMTLSAVYVATARVSKQATFEAETTGTLKAINERLDKIDIQLAKQNVTNTANLPQSAFSKSLTELSQALSTARELKAAISHSTITQIQEKLLATNPTTPNYWHSATQLVDLKFQSTEQTHASNCLDTLNSGAPETDQVFTGGGFVNFPNFTEPQVPKWMSHVILSNCTISLDDHGNFPATSVGKFFQKVKDHHPQADRFFLVLNNVHITYSGGKILPVSGIEYENCTFEFTPPTSVPANPFQSMMTQLLAANSAKGVVTIPVG